MNAKRKIPVSAIILALFFAAILFFLYYAVGSPYLLMTAIQPHKGDGEMKDVSRRLGPIAYPEYEIKMPDFDLGVPTKLHLRFSNLPTFDLAGCRILFVVRSTQENSPWKLETTANASLRLSDSNGNEMFSSHCDFSEDNVWGGTAGQRWPNYFLMRGPYPNFHPNPNMEYHLDVDFHPDPKLKGRNAFVLLDCGRRK